MNFFRRFIQNLTGAAPGKSEKKQSNASKENALNKQSINQTKNPMTMYNYGIGGNEVKIDASEAIHEIQPNKTLIVSKLTDDEPLQPEAVYGLKTVEDVFKRFKPEINAEFENDKGETVREALKFNNLGDFTAKNLTEQSSFLSELNVQQEQYAKIIKQLKSNKVLRSVLENLETKEAFVEALKNLAQELESNNVNN